MLPVIVMVRLIAGSPTGICESRPGSSCCEIRIDIGWVMLKLTGFALWIAGATGVFGQGTFGQIAFGGCWQTTLTLINQNSAAMANVAIFFYGDDGSPLSTPVQGIGSVTTYKFTIQPGNRQDVVLFNSDANSTAVEGWANVATTGDVELGGQGSFLCRTAGRPDYQSVVPLNALKSSPCLVP